MYLGQTSPFPVGPAGTVFDPETGSFVSAPAMATDLPTVTVTPAVLRAQNRLAQTIQRAGVGGDDMTPWIFGGLALAAYMLLRR